MWFWEVSPRHWTPVQWGIFLGVATLMFAIFMFGCGIESIVELAF